MSIISEPTIDITTGGGRTMSANGPLIRRLRTDAGLSTRALSALAHVAPSTISRVERGQTGPTPPPTWNCSNGQRRRRVARVG